MAQTKTQRSAAAKKAAATRKRRAAESDVQRMKRSASSATTNAKSAAEAAASTLENFAKSALHRAEALRKSGRAGDGAAVVERLAENAHGRRSEWLERAAALREEAGDDEAAERLLQECLTGLPADGDRAGLC